MTQKLHIKTWGCQMNEYDSSKMADLLHSTHGLELTDVPEEADVLLLNTCSIREKAQEKVFHQLGRRRRWLRSIARRRAYPHPRTLCGHCFWAANVAPLAGND